MLILLLVELVEVVRLRVVLVENEVLDVDIEMEVDALTDVELVLVDLDVEVD